MSGISASALGSVRDCRARARTRGTLCTHKGILCTHKGGVSFQSQVATSRRPTGFYERLAKLPFLLITWIICK